LLKIVGQPHPAIAALERSALTAELSMRSFAEGPLARASAWKRFTHTPLAAQRTYRL